MRVPRPEEPGSLDLLLDTMSNVLGGVMFIAILLCLSGKGLPGSILPTKARGEDAEALRKARELDLLERTLVADRERLTALGARRLELFDDGKETFLFDPSKDDVEAILKRLEDLRARARVAAQSRRKSEAAADAAREADRATVMVEQEAARLEAEVAAARQRCEEARTKLERTKAESTRIARTPLIRATQKAPFVVWLAHGKLISVFLIGPNGRPEKNTRDCRFTVVDDDLRVERLSPGTPVSAGFAASDTFDEMFKRVDPSERYVNVGVEPDSYREAGILLRALDEAGFESQWTPLDSGKPVILGDSKHEVQ